MKDNPQDTLNSKDKNYFAILAHYLKAQGGSAQLSAAKFADLVNHNFTNRQDEISTSTAERKLNLFKDLKLIDKSSRGSGCVPSLITLLQSCQYEGSLPTGVIPAGSPIYIKREEEEACKQALKIKSLIRDDLPFIKIKAPFGWGKSTLLRFLETYAYFDLHRIVCFIDLNSYVFDNTFHNMELFLKKFAGEILESFLESMTISQEVTKTIDKYWQRDESPGKKCTNFLKEEVFRKASEKNKHIVLFIDSIDKVFGEEIETKFLGMLRTWYEKFMKPSVTRTVVGPSMVIAYSTEPYKDFKGSPFNVGTPISLKPFSTQNIQDLAQGYGMTFDLSEAQYLENLLGGHPTLVQHALYYMNQENINLDKLSQICTQLNGPFGHILYDYTTLLKENNNLALCFKQIIHNETCYDELGKFLLERAGLIYRDSNLGDIKVSSILYQKYFDTLLWQLG